jgi:ABC-2 type transport system ATP-binding protein
MAGLIGRENSLTRELSGGWKQRLSLGCAILHRPRILFLDEPTSGLDVQSVRFMRALLRNLKQEGKTIFLTTHNIDEASQMCDRVAIINHGKIVAIDTPERLKRTVENLQSVEVAFETVSPNMLKELKEFPNVSNAVKEGDKFRLITNDPTSVLTSTWNYAQKNNLRLITVNTLGPSLEDVFVKLTGIRPATEEEGNDRIKAQEMPRRIAKQ